MTLQVDARYTHPKAPPKLSGPPVGHKRFVNASPADLAKFVASFPSNLIPPLQPSSDLSSSLTHPLARSRFLLPPGATA